MLMLNTRILHLIAVTISAASLSHAGTVLSTTSFTGANNTGALVSGPTWYAVGLETGASSVDFTSLSGYFNNSNTQSTATFGGGIYSESSAHPGTLLAAFVSQSLNAATLSTLLTFATASTYTLNASTDYWFVIDPVGSPFWEATALSGASAPTAISGYTFLGFRSTSNSGTSWTTGTSNPTVKIDVADAVATPEPSSLALLMVGGSALLAGLGAKRVS